MLVSGCLGSGPGVTWGKGNLGLVCESLTKEVAGSVGSGRVSCVSKVGSHRSSLLSLGVSLPRAGQPLQEQGPKCQSIKNIENIVNQHGAEHCYLPEG